MFTVRAAIHIHVELVTAKCNLDVSIGYPRFRYCWRKLLAFTFSLVALWEGWAARDARAGVARASPARLGEDSSQNMKVPSKFLTTVSVGGGCGDEGLEAAGGGCGRRVRTP
ncbi:hypothetical protein B5X24_HaOG203155 [Helicoverpa armigera]|uniref:Uncharacterized protein n=1 Tax=Helicoverpa armigera TaxID=29058 RepID=A0A2W1BR94_HELAM|nr:hypothetical protein B5X24_HaOG203155 [Helicoverpa armigera]